MRIRQSIAAVALVAGATAGGLALAGPAAATGQTGLVNVHVQDVANGNQVVLLNNVPVTLAAVVCGLDANVLSTELLTSNKVVCAAKNNSKTLSWISNG